MRRQAVDFGLPQRLPLLLVRLAPGRRVELGAGHGFPGGGTDQADAVLDAAVLQHARHMGQDKRRAVRALVGHETGIAARADGLTPKRKRGLGG